MKKWVYFLLLVLSQACQSPTYQLDLKKFPNIDHMEIQIPQAKEHPLIGKPLKVQVIFPPEMKEQTVETQLKIWGPEVLPAKNPKNKPEMRWMVSVPRSLGLIPLAIMHESDEATLTVKLGPNLEVPDLKPYDINSNPKTWTEISQDAYPSVGKMERVVESWFFGLFVDSKASCTVSVIGKNLVLTNAHCVHNSTHCEKAEFHFSNIHEKGFFGGRVWRSYDCKKIIASSVEYDFTIAETHQDPSAHYPDLPMDLSQRTFRQNQKILVIANNQTKHMKRCEVISENRHCTVLPKSDADLASECFRFHVHKIKCDKKIIPGDSGSPVFDDRGMIVGVVWGGLNPADETGYIIPAWTIGKELTRQGVSGKAFHTLSAP